jgi:hypothetical protein
LKGYDVVLGKLFGGSLHAFYGLLTILPLLGLPLMMGGVTPGEFWRVALVLVATLGLSLSIGMVVSSLSRETRQAITSTLLMMVVLAGILPALWWLHALVAKTRGWDVLLWPSPVYSYSHAFDSYFRARGQALEFWRSLGMLASLSAGALAAASFQLGRVWREKGEDARGNEGESRWRGFRFGNEEFRQRHKRWLEKNPFFWLASRDRLAQRLPRWTLGALLPIWLCFVVGAYSKSNSTAGMCFSVSLLVLFGLHGVLKCLIAVESSRRLSEDRQSGALELLLVTPLPVEQIVAGQMRALRKSFRVPVLLIVIVNVVTFWVICTAQTLRMQRDPMVIFGEILAGGVVALLLDFHALTNMGMWMALRTKKHHRAIFATVGRIILPPWVGIVFMFFLGAGRGINTNALQIWIAFYFVIGLLLDLWFMARARRGARAALRPVAPLRYRMKAFRDMNAAGAELIGA